MLVLRVKTPFSSYPGDKADKDLAGEQMDKR